MVRLTGLVAAVSAWVLALATSQLRNATVSDLIIGLAVAAVGLLVITGLRGLTGLQAASLLADSGGSSGRSSWTRRSPSPRRCTGATYGPERS